MGPADVLLLLLMGVCVFFALHAIRRGKGSCSSGCSACPMAGQCRKQHKQKNKQK